MSTHVASCEPLDPQRADAVRLLDAALDLLDERAHVARVLRAGDHEGVDDTEELRHGEHDGVAPELGVGRLRGGGHGGRQLDSDVQPLPQWSTSRIPTVSPKAPTRMEHAAMAQRCLRPSRQLQLGPTVGPALGRGSGDAPTWGLSDSSVHPAGMALI